VAAPSATAPTQRPVGVLQLPKPVELSTPLTLDGELRFYTWDDDEGKRAFWHSSAHIMAQAIKKHYPNAKLTIGPPFLRFYYEYRLRRRNLYGKGFPQNRKNLYGNSPRKASLPDARSEARQGRLGIFTGKGKPTLTNRKPHSEGPQGRAKFHLFGGPTD